jgi:hypothetical protein
MKKRPYLGICSVAVALALAGCGGSTSNRKDPNPALSFMNLVPDTAGLKFVIDDATLASNQAYLQYNTDFPFITYRTAEEGGSEYIISDATTGIEIERDSSEFALDTDNIVLAVGKQNPGSEVEKRLQQTVISINRRIVPGKARLFIINAFVPASGINLKNINFRNVDPANPTSNSRPLYGRDNLVFGAFRSDISVIDIDAGTWTFQARDAEADAVTVIAQKDFTFERDKLYMAVVVGQEDATDPARQPKIEFLPIASKL